MPRKKPSTKTDAKKPAPALAAKAPHGSKSAYVRGLPREVSAKEVVEKAKAAGIQLSVAQVYNIRSTSKGTKKMKRAAVAASTEPQRIRRSVDIHADPESRLRRLVAEVGLVRSREILAEVGAAFAG